MAGAVNEYVEYLQEVFELFGPIRARRMFGGYGIFYEGLMFGLVQDEMLYLKADGENARYFEARGLGQFEYDKGGKVIRMSYYLAPDEIMEDRELAALWARRSYEAARRARGVAQH
jgi:DNA transformation protein and related proteins